ncbi:MAG: threonylcarbamoyl-AMP synthase [Clostridia bacterium]|nr:threonylcarbamoyl-AMP synthase [Clostridia bacterium]
METVFTPATAPAIEQAAALLRQGRLVAFPTETVYGLGADALNEEAVAAIFAAKGRPGDNPLIVHVAEKSQLDELCEVTADAEKLMDAFWPGPLTILLKKKPAVPDITTAGLPSVAVRCPDHPVALALLRESRVPVAAPSANRSGRPSPTTAQHVLEDMDGRIAMILQGGDCRVGVESTVLDMTKEVPCILRPGAVTREMVISVLGRCTVADSVMRPLKEGEAAPSPGMKHRHYAPQASMTVYTGDREKVITEICRRYDENENAVILALEGDLPSFGDRRALSIGTSPEETAHLLFKRLRETDEMGVSLVLAQGWEGEEMVLAVMNRMARAAAFDVIRL